MKYANTNTLLAITLTMTFFVGGFLIAKEKVRTGEASMQLVDLQTELRYSEGENRDLHFELEDSLKTEKKLRETISLLTKESMRNWNVSDAVITAYSPLDDQNGLNADSTPEETSIGMKVGYGRFAVDPARIPYGSKILIVYADGTTESGIAADTGGALRNAEHIAIDVYRQTFDQAMEFGTNPATVIWQAPSSQP